MVKTLKLLSCQFMVAWLFSCTLSMDIKLHAIFGDNMVLQRDMRYRFGEQTIPAKTLQPETPALNAAAVFEAFTSQTIKDI